MNGAQKIVFSVGARTHDLSVSHEHFCLTTRSRLFALDIIVLILFQASVHSLGQNAFIGSMIVEAQTMDMPNYWIGLHSLYGTYFWSDESHTDYIFWGSKQPDQSWV